MRRRTELRADVIHGQIIGGDGHAVLVAEGFPFSITPGMETPARVGYTEVDEPFTKGPEAMACVKSMYLAWRSVSL